VDRETEGISDALELIDSLFDLPEPRRKKCESLFKLARRSTGYIVELGTFHGNGYIALSLGADPDQMVFTVDDYSPKEGWAGEKYGPYDKGIFEYACRKANVKARLIEDEFSNVAKDFWPTELGYTISLLFWDAGQDKLRKTMEDWEPLIDKGGILAIHDTYSYMFGAKDYMSKMVSDGKYCQYEVMPGGVHVAVKR
jgi:predicted O-methyltransferase YrrM